MTEGCSGWMTQTNPTSLKGSHMSRNRMQAILRSGVAPAILTPAFANTLTGLIPSLYAGLDIVSRELVGLAPTVTRNVAAERAAVGQTVVFPIVPDATTSNVVPQMAIPEPGDKAIANNTLTITKSKSAEFGITGEEALGLGGNMWQSIQADLFAQGVRALVNELEADGMAEAYANAGLFYAAPAGGLFSGDKMTDAAQMRKLLDDQGAPITGRAMILSTASGANMRSMYNLTRANEAGTTMTLRDGELMELMGFSVHESGQGVTRTQGTAAAATTDATGYAVGATTITLAAAGTGTFVAGDVIQFAGDSNRYVVRTGDTDVSNGGSITLTSGLRQAIPAAATAITRPIAGTSFTGQGVAFSRDAMVLAARAPALPPGGDAARERMQITDPRSGITFEVSVYEGYRKLRYEVALAWGWKAVKPRHIIAAA